MSELTLTLFRSTPVPKARVCQLVTEGRNPAIDTLAICEELLLELPPFQRQAIVQYLQTGVVPR